MLVGWLAPSASSPDYPAFAVAAAALGGGKGSLMFQEIRQKLGIGYEIGTSYPILRYQGHLVAYLTTDPYKSAPRGARPTPLLEDVRQSLISLVDRLKGSELSAEDLERAKGYTIGTYALSHQHLIDRALLLGRAEAIAGSYQFDTNYADRIQAVTAADVQRVARKYLNNYAAVVLLPRPKSEPSQ